MEYRKFITRDMLKNEPETLFVFGDNVVRHGFGGQAKEMRGEPNAVGIPTKWKPSNETDAFFKNFQYPAVKLLIDEDTKILFQHHSYGGKIVWPEDGIGTGLARLPQTAPLIWFYIERIRLYLDGSQPQFNIDGYTD